jgi:large subunit ribosomal protein L4
MSTQVDILNSEGQASGSVELPEDLFAIEVSEYALYRAVVAYEANQRQGTASVKTRSEIARTSKKHHRQKGTGWARRGSMRSPLVRGGGVAFGPQPRSYYEKLPKSLKRLALRSALTVKGSGDQIKVIEDFYFSEPSTKSFEKILDACGLKDQKLLFITAENAPMLVKSSRNLPKVNIAHLGSLGTYNLLRADIVLFTHQAFDKFVETHRQQG